MTASKMKVEIQDCTPSAPERSNNSSSVDEIMTRQLNNRLASVLNNISSKHYDRQEHKKRLQQIQNNLDEKYDTKKQHSRLVVNHHMAGPAFKKIIEKRRNQLRKQKNLEQSKENSIENLQNDQSMEDFDSARKISESKVRNILL